MNGQKIQIVPHRRRFPRPRDVGAGLLPRSPRRPSILAAAGAAAAFVLIFAGVPALIMFLAWELWP